MPTRVLFVCLGNICRSPTAEGIMRRLVRERGLEGGVEVDSAATSRYEVGNPPDPRAVEAAAARGTELVGEARQVTRSDFEHADVILAMDRGNLRDLRRAAPPGTGDKIRMLDDRDVPDPWYGGADGFDAVYSQIEAACRRLLDDLPAASR